MNAVLGGWTWAETFYYHTGYPFSVIDNGVRTADVANIDTNQVLGQSLIGVGGTTCTSPTTPCSISSQFVTDPTAQTNFGNFRRNSFRGPNYFDTHPAFSVPGGTSFGAPPFLSS